MALPQFRAVSAVATGQAADATVTLPTHAADDIILLFVETQAGEAAVVNTPAGYVAVADSPQSTGSGGTSTTLSVFWARAASASETNPEIEGTALNHVIAFAASFSGCITSGNPWNVTSGGATTGTTTKTMTGDTTTVDDCLVVVALTNPFDGTSDTFFSNWTNANLANLTERFDANRAVGGGGAIGMATGEKATQGDYGDTTVDVPQTNQGAYITIALKPPTPAAGATRALMYARRRGR